MGDSLSEYLHNPSTWLLKNNLPCFTSSAVTDRFTLHTQAYPLVPHHMFALLVYSPLQFISLFILDCTCTHPRNCNEDSISTMVPGKRISPDTITVEVLILAKRRCKWRKVENCRCCHHNGNKQTKNKLSHYFTHDTKRTQLASSHSEIDFFFYSRWSKKHAAISLKLQNK